MRIKFFQTLIDLVRFKWLYQMYINPYHYKTFTTPEGTYCSFGELNKDKVFYIITRNKNENYGVFSAARFAMRYLAFIEGTDLIPVIDFSGNKAYQRGIQKNFWDNYFKQPSGYTLDEVYKSKHCIICPKEYIFNNKVIDNLEPEMFKKYFRLNDNMETILKQYDKLIGDKCLGIHFRGTDMKSALFHPTPAVYKQMLKYIDLALKKADCNEIFLATDEKRYKDIIEKHCKKKNIPLKIIDSEFGGFPALYNWGEEKRREEKPDLQLPGKEIIMDLMLLSRCKALLGVPTNPLTCASMLNNSSMNFFIDNGSNIGNGKFNELRFNIAEKLPLCMIKLLGLKNKLNIYTGWKNIE